MEDDKVKYQKAESKLIAKKEELFISGVTTKWDLSFEDENIKFEFSKDKNLALPKMLPKVY